MYKIFLVEDDNVIANQVEKHLRSWNYEVIIAKDFHDIMSDFAKSEAEGYRTKSVCKNRHIH